MRPPTISQARKQRVDVAMTPMIDAIFQLQIFFLCTLGMGGVNESLLPTRLPDKPAQPAGAQAAPNPQTEEVVIVQLRGAGPELKIQLNQRQVQDLRELRSLLVRLGEVSKAMPTVLDIGPEVLLGDLVSAYDACLEAGMMKIHFAAEKRGVP